MRKLLIILLLVGVSPNLWADPLDYRLALILRDFGLMYPQGQNFPAGSISGSVSAGLVAFGTAANTIGTDSNFRWDSTKHHLYMTGETTNFPTTFDSALNITIPNNQLNSGGISIFMPNSTSAGTSGYSAICPTNTSLIGPIALAGLVAGNFTSFFAITCDSTIRVTPLTNPSLSGFPSTVGIAQAADGTQSVDLLDFLKSDGVTKISGFDLDGNFTAIALSDTDILLSLNTHSSTASKPVAIFSNQPSASCSSFSGIVCITGLGTASSNAGPLLRINANTNTAYDLGLHNLSASSALSGLYCYADSAGFSECDNIDNSVSFDSIIFGPGAATSVSGSFQSQGYKTASNCSNAASPAACGAAPSGVVAVPTGASPTLQINTTAVTSTSRIFIQIDESSTIAATTCNSTLATLVQPVVTARTPGASFTIQINATLAVNPACVSYFIMN